MAELSAAGKIGYSVRVNNSGFSLFDGPTGRKLLIGLPVLCAWLWLALALVLPPDAGLRVMADANTFYCAGRIANADSNPYDPLRLMDCAASFGGSVAPYFHSPLSLPIFQPWALLPHPAALGILTLLQSLALMVIGQTLWSLLKNRSRTARMLTLALLLVSDTLQSNLLHGQLNLLALALALLAARHFAARKMVRSGVLLALALLLKPYLGLLALALIHPLSWLSLLVTLGVFALPGLSQTTPELWPDFWTAAASAVLPVLPGYSGMNWVQAGNLGVIGTLDRLGFPHDLAAGLGMGLGSLLLLLSMGIFLARKIPQPARFSILLPLTVLLPAMSWVTYLIWALPAALAIEGGAGLLLALGLLLPYDRMSSGELNPVLLLPTLVLLLIWARLLSDAARHKGAQETLPSRPPNSLP